MEVTGQLEFGGYHIYLHNALGEAVEAYERHNSELRKYPAPTQETATPETVALHFSLEERRATVILLAASCVEALANLLLAMKTTAEQFEVLERANFIEKWVVLPGLFLKGYTFPKDSTLYQDLKCLHARRNALAHLKEHVIREDEFVHKGKFPKAASDEQAFVGRCRSLPSRLVEHVVPFDSTGDLAAMRFGLSFKWSDTQSVAHK